MMPLAGSAIPVEEALVRAPYLRRLHARLEIGCDAKGVAEAYEQAMQTCRVAPEAEGPEAVMKVLRQAKARAHLAIALGDLCHDSSLSQTTQMITDFADTSVEAALQTASRQAGVSADGLFMIALGKMGAGELNYSSDIDMAAFFDPDRFDSGDRDPVDTASRIVREAMRLLDAHTGDGYVFRTDLRLRPDPSSTPLAISTRRAELYYESVGQNWERMVWIKARAAAGDHEAAARFLKMMEPFVWRRHLDYWAIADVQAIKNMINAKAGDQSLSDPAPDVKLGVGGIREIEFFVQTQQIILGGRNPALRVRGTLEGLAQLVDLGSVEAEVADDLTRAYETLRAVEHRIQMLEDEQTHTLPRDEARRADVAALCGIADLAAFDAAVAATRRCVHQHYSNLFADEARKHKASVSGNLVFTGVDDDPATLATLTSLGFEDPARVIHAVRQWHRARTPATRTARGRELLTAMLPDLLAAMGQTGEADIAFARFSLFFEGLRSGVQTLSMLAAEPKLMRDLVATLALAPSISETLARRPGLLEALLSVSDRKAKPELEADTSFEEAMDQMRRWHGERAFLIGHGLLHGAIPAREAAKAWSELADACVRQMSEAALLETERRFGPAPGTWCLAAMGKLGGEEMTATSDLDVLVIYDPVGESDAQLWFTRFTQRLITALSAETGEGRLYEVDMRLRPSGRAGPVATSLASFDRYHHNEAWTWEHMALTRLRPVTGDPALGDKVIAIVRDVVAHGDAAQRTADILDMRNRLLREKPPTSAWDLKMREGGLVDLEFIVQHALLTSTAELPHMPHLPEAIQALEQGGVLTRDEAETLSAGQTFLQSLQQVQRLALHDKLVQEHLSAGLKDRLVRATESADFAALEAELERVCSAITDLRCKKIGPPATES